MIEELKAGRELDALVAEKVMGLQVYQHSFWGPAFDKQPEPSGAIYAEPIPHYSTDIAAAWQVVEKMNLTIGPDFISGARRWVAVTSIALYVTIREEGDTAPLAICLAALKAVTASHS